VLLLQEMKAVAAVAAATMVMVAVVMVTESRIGAHLR